MPFHARHVSPPAGVEGFRLLIMLIGAPENFNFWGEREPDETLMSAGRSVCVESVLPRSVVRLSRFGLNHNAGITTLVILRFVGDRSDHVAGRQSHSGCECRQGGNQDGDDDFDNFLACHRLRFFRLLPRLGGGFVCSFSGIVCRFLLSYLIWVYRIYPLGGMFWGMGTPKRVGMGPVPRRVYTSPAWICPPLAVYSSPLFRRAFSQIRCKDIAKKRSHQESGFAEFIIDEFFSIMCQIVARISGK